jgi:NAD(P)-dependent dehydrogenase (short-subunit alcohol dehydrogenase family)
MQIEGAVALITGAASGIGFGIATALARRKATVILGDIHLERARAAADTLRAAGLSAHALHLDVTRTASWESAAREILAHGRLSILCNNAGAGGGRDPIEHYPIDRWQWVNAVNVTALLQGVKTFLPGMRLSGQPGHIVNTVSMLGIVATPNTVGYIATKFAAMGLCLQLRQELRGSPIGVSALCPGMVHTRIVETTARLSPGGQKTLDDETIESMHAVMSSGVEPVKVGERVARGIERNEFYIFTHPEWRSLVEGHYQEMLQAFGDAADPQHRDPIETIAAVQPGSPQR